MPDPSRPAQLLSQLSRYPNPALWGFPLDSDHIIAEFNKTLPPDFTGDDKSRFSLYSRFCLDFFWDLAMQCDGIWASRKATAGVRMVRSKGKSTKRIIAIVKCTHADDRLLPPPEKIEELRKLVVALGFEEEPGWFIKQ